MRDRYLEVPTSGLSPRNHYHSQILLRTPEHFQ